MVMDWTSTSFRWQDGFPQSVIFDNEHLKLLFEFVNSEVEVQQDQRVGLAMSQDVFFFYESIECSLMMFRKSPS